MPRVIFPCKDCPERYIGCHAICKKYKEAQAENTKCQIEKYKSKVDGGYTGLDYARHFDRMQGKYHGKVFKSIKK